MTDFRIGVDGSNYTDHVSDAWDSWISNHNVRLLLPQSLNPPAGYPSGRTAEQILWALDRRLLIAPYIWKWFGVDDIQRRLDVISQFAGQVDHLWLDVEDTTPGVLGAALSAPALPPQHLARMRRQPPPIGYPRVRAARQLGTLSSRVDEVARALERCDQFPTKSGLKTGIYSGGWFWGPYMGGTTAFADRPCWPSLYDGIVDPNVWTPFGGWLSVALKQFQGTTVLDGVSGVDLSVLAEGYLVSDPTPTPTPNGDVDWGWQNKKDDVVHWAGELRVVAQQIRDEANRRGGARKKQMLGLADGVQGRADSILR